MAYFSMVLAVFLWLFADNTVSLCKGAN